MSETPDQIVFSQALESGSSSDQSPFVKKELLYIQDNNGSGNYSSNQVIFDATILSNNGKNISWQESKIIIPCIFTVSNETTDSNWTAGDLSHSDFMLALKNCNTSLIHSYSIDFGNQTVINATPFVNMYHAFKYHTELNDDEEELLGAEIGYAKDTSDSWMYRSASASEGQGLCNNNNGYVGVKNTASTLDNSVMNLGMTKRQENWMRRCGVNPTVPDGKSLVLGADENMHFKNEAQNYVLNTDTAKHYFYNAVIRLKDLNFFNSPDFPRLVRNAYFKITLNVNQFQFTFKKLSTGLISFDKASLSLTSGGTLPIIIASSYANVSCSSTASNGVITASASGARIIPCGSACLPCATDQTYRVSFSVCKSLFVHRDGANTVPAQSCAMSACRLYLPAYTPNNDRQQELLQLGQKEIKYLDLLNPVQYNVNPGAFQWLLTSGVARAKRLIIVPVLTESVNFSETGIANAFSDIQSPFSSSPSTTAPILLQQFQVLIGGVPLYNQAINYNFETFYQEMVNTSLGGQMIQNMVAGRITYKDFVNGMYNYIVVDLRRRLPQDESALTSISITGNLTSLKAVHLYAFIEYERSCIIDLTTGQRIQSQ
jgi:hypothetical protein